MDEISIDNYADNLELYPNIAEIESECKKDEWLNSKVRIFLRKRNEVLTSRGGQAPNVEKKTSRTYPCCLPFSQMIIRPTGEVSLCCNDALGKITLGDIKQSSIKEIWNGDAYKHIRELCTENRLGEIALCKYCDTKFYDS